jgi:thiosulfate dehydrogenase
VRRQAIAVFPIVLTGCTVDHVVNTETVHGTAADHGAAIFHDPAASPAPGNAFACSTCHLTEPDASSKLLLPGAALAGAVDRPLFWGGQEDDLLRSLDDCRRRFMSAADPWSATDPEAEALYAYLASLPADAAQQKVVPFTVVPAAADLPAGDPKLGADVFARACQSCHGALHTGDGRLTPKAVRLPDDPLATYAGAQPANLRVIFVEKVRHGGFLGYGGTMPPFSQETLSDAQLAGLLAYFALYP